MIFVHLQVCLLLSLTLALLVCVISLINCPEKKLKYIYICIYNSHLFLIDFTFLQWREVYEKDIDW